MGLEYTVADPGFWKGEGVSVHCPLPSCSPAHLNDLVNGCLFTEPTDRDRWDKAELARELVEKLLFTADWER